MEFAGDKGFYSCWRTLKRSRWRLRALRGSKTKGRLVLALKLIFVGRHPSRSAALCWPASHNPNPRGVPDRGRSLSGAARQLISADRGLLTHFGRRMACAA